MKDKRNVQKASNKNKEYGMLITKESDTIRQLHEKLSPRMGNFLKARRDIEPFDDLDKIRQTKLDDRLFELRKKIYKGRESPTPSPLIKKRQ